MIRRRWRWLSTFREYRLAMRVIELETIYIRIRLLGCSVARCPDSIPLYFRTVSRLTVMNGRRKVDSRRSQAKCFFISDKAPGLGDDAAHASPQPLNENTHENKILYLLFCLFILLLLDDAAQRSFLIRRTIQQSMAVEWQTQCGFVGAPNVHSHIDETTVPFRSRRNCANLRCCFLSNPIGTTAPKSMASISHFHIIELWRTGDSMC